MRAVLLAVIVFAGCSGRNNGAQPPSEDAEPPAKPAPVEPEEPDLPPPPSLDDLRLPSGVPGLTQSVVDKPRSRRAQRLNRSALEHHNRGEYDEAIERYKKALTIDPGNVLARYNLSCAFNLNAQPEAGLALLKQFYDTGCDECRERLARAAEDAEWHDRWDDPRFVQLVAVKADDSRDTRWWKKPEPCPEGAELQGATPPEGHEIYCARRSGRREGMTTVWKDGNLVEQGSYERGRKQGPWLVFDENGVLAESGEQERGRREGPWSSWAPSGEQLSDGRYKSGKKHGTWTYFSPAGAVENTELWRNGRLVATDGEE